MKLNISNNAIKYIQLQRTDHKVPGMIADAYSKDIEDDFNIIKEYLPEKATNVLDIGCGIGGIDVLLYHYFVAQNTNPHMWMLDKSEFPTQMRYGWGETTPFYNSLDLTYATLLANDVPSKNIHCVEANLNFTIDIPTNVEMTLVTSFLSWGFHYPVESYIKNVMKILTKRGRVIIDLRYESDVNVLKLYFKNVEIIIQKGKAYRTVCWGKK